jgi:hypothetical protein
MGKKEGERIWTIFAQHQQGHRAAPALPTTSNVKNAPRKSGLLVQRRSLLQMFMSSEHPEAAPRESLPGSHHMCIPPTTTGRMEERASRGPERTWRAKRALSSRRTSHQLTTSRRTEGWIDPHHEDETARHGSPRWQRSFTVPDSGASSWVKRPEQEDDSRRGHWSHMSLATASGTVERSARTAMHPPTGSQGPGGTSCLA